MSDFDKVGNPLGAIFYLVLIFGTIPASIPVFNWGVESGKKDGLEEIADRKQKRYLEFVERVNPYFQKTSGMSFVEWLENERKQEQEAQAKLEEQKRLDGIKSKILELQTELEKTQNRAR